jgi:hypothetical protein
MMNLRTLTLFAVAAATIGLSGCVVVPASGYGGPGYAVAPAPVAVYPAPYYGGYGGYGYGGYVRFGGHWHH